MLLVYCYMNIYEFKDLHVQYSSKIIYKSIELFMGVMAFVGVDLLFLSLLIKKG